MSKVSLEKQSDSFSREIIGFQILISLPLVCVLVAILKSFGGAVVFIGLCLTLK